MSIDRQLTSTVNRLWATADFVPAAPKAAAPAVRKCVRRELSDIAAALQISFS